MKHILIVIALLATSSFGLDKVSSLPKNQAKLLDKLITKLHLPDDISKKKRTELYDKFGTFLEKDWSAHWNSNTSLSDSKLENSKTQVIDLMIYNNERVTNITFIYFSTEKQLLVATKQYIETKSSSAMDSFHETEKSKDYTKESESDNYAYFEKKGFVSYNGYHVEEPVGLIIYESASLIDFN